MGKKVNGFMRPNTLKRHTAISHISGARRQLPSSRHMVASAGGFGPPPPLETGGLAVKPVSSWARNKAPKTSPLLSSGAPGPGRYDFAKPLADEYNGGSMSPYKFKSTLEMNLGEAMENPGPGAYNYDDFDRPRTGTKFGVSSREAQSPSKAAQARNGRNVGPGEYNLGQLSPIQSHNGRFLRAARSPDESSSAALSPPVGAYNAGDAKDRLQSTSQGTRFSEGQVLDLEALRLRRAKSLPGPGSYEQPSFKSHAKTKPGRFVSLADVERPPSEVDPDL